MNDYYVSPVIMTEFFKNTKIKDLTLDEISNNLQEAIIEDPELSDTTNIAVKAKNESDSKEPVIHLIGKVASEADRARAKEIIEKNTSNSIKVANELAIE
ncbi:MAG: hypothetical protein K9M94_14150 [Spirochaetia bacterium]|nr:hypothetical protein [Spirochaetia bacterium]